MENTILLIKILQQKIKSQSQTRNVHTIKSMSEKYASTVTIIVPNPTITQCAITQQQILMLWLNIRKKGKLARKKYLNKK